MQQSWHRGYLLPLLLALLIHLVFFVLMLAPALQQSTQVPIPAAVPVLSYLYSAPIPPPTTTLPAITPATDTRVADTADIAKNVTEVAPPVTAAVTAKAATASDTAQPATAPKTAQASSEQRTEAEHSTDVQQRTLNVDSAAKPATTISERVLATVTQQYQTPAADYASWAKQQQQPRIVVTKQHQQAGTDPAKAVLHTYGDGKQLVKVGDRCLVVDPTLSGFEQLMKAGGAPCKESDDAILFRQTMAKWLNR